MALSFRNSLSKSQEPFVPLDPAGRRVLLYSCGPTVYSYAHIGNFRSFLLADLVRRLLNRRSFEVRHVMNITDVGHMTEDHLADASGEDKLSKAARELGWDPFQVARHFEAAFIEDARALKLKNYLGDDAEDGSLHPRATDFIPEMLVLIQALLERGFAYVDELGQAYFEIAKFAEYGELSGKNVDELEAGARVEQRDGKRDPRDFALWKVDSKHLMQWDPHTGGGFRGDDFERLRRLLPGGVDLRLGAGFPGWHIECSAMARSRLADVIDIHTGGEDNLFPHHECETAQTCGALGVSVTSADGTRQYRNFCRFWLHGRHLLVEGRKMSKRDGTFYTVRNLLDPAGSGRPDLVEPLSRLGFPNGRVSPEVVRLALLSCSFLLPMNFSFDTLVQARANVARIQARYERLQEVLATAPEPAPPSVGAAPGAESVLRFQTAFDTALDDNLDVATAMAAVHAFVRELNQRELGPAEALSALRSLEGFDDIFAVIDRRARAGVIEGSELERWLSADYLSDRAVELWAWREQPERSALLRALEAGELPSNEAFAKLTQLDADVTVLLLAARYQAKQHKQYQRSDQLRDLLKAARASVDDLPGGRVRWKLS